MKEARGGGRWWWALFALVALSGVAATALLGPERTWRIARAAAASVVLDGLVEHPGQPHIPVWRIQRDRDQQGQATLHEGEARLAMTWTAMEPVPGMRPEHATWRIELSHATPQVPVRALWLDRGGIMDMLHGHLVHTAAGRLGVVATWSTPVGLRIDGARGRVCWLRERAGPELLRDRQVIDREGVACRHVGKGWSCEGRDHDDARAAWQRFWAMCTDTSVSPMDRRDSLMRLVDVEAWLRFDAVLEALDASPEEMVVVHDPRSDRWMPVLEGVRATVRDSLGMRVVDQVIRAMMQEPDLAHRRQVLHSDAVQRLRSGEFDALLDALLERTLPALLADRDKYDRVMAGDNTLFRVPAAQVTARAHTMRAAYHAYWKGSDRMNDARP